MCAVSMVIDYYQNNLPPIDGKANPQWDLSSMKELLEIKKKLDELDKKLNQKECVDPQKDLYIKQLELRIKELEIEELKRKLEYYESQNSAKVYKDLIKRKVELESPAKWADSPIYNDDPAKKGL